MTDLNSKILKSSSGKLHDVAQMVYHILYKDYKYEAGRWIHQINDQWLDDSDGISLRRDIDNIVVKAYIDFIRENNSNAFDHNDEEKYKCLAISRELTTITYYLRTKDYKEKLLCNCASLWSKMN